MHNRQKDEILRDILTVCNGGSPVTKVMFHAYLTHSQTKEYLHHLIENGLVQRDPIEKKFHTTPKGMEYLAMISKMSELFRVATKRTAPKDQLVSPFTF